MKKMTKDKFKVGDLVETGMLWPGIVMKIYDTSTLGIRYFFETNDNADKITDYADEKWFVTDINVYHVAKITETQLANRLRLGKKALQNIFRVTKGDREEYLRIVDKVKIPYSPKMREYTKEETSKIINGHD